MCQYCTVEDASFYFSTNSAPPLYVCSSKVIVINKVLKRNKQHLAQSAKYSMCIKKVYPILLLLCFW